MKLGDPFSNFFNPGFDGNGSGFVGFVASTLEIRVGLGGGSELVFIEPLGALASSAAWLFFVLELK